MVRRLALGSRDHPSPCLIGHSNIALLAKRILRPEESDSREPSRELDYNCAGTCSYAEGPDIVSPLRHARSSREYLSENVSLELGFPHGAHVDCAIGTSTLGAPSLFIRYRPEKDEASD